MRSIAPIADGERGDGELAGQYGREPYTGLLGTDETQLLRDKAATYSIPYAVHIDIGSFLRFENLRGTAADIEARLVYTGKKPPSRLVAYAELEALLKKWKKLGKSTRDIYAARSEDDFRYPNRALIGLQPPSY